MNIIYTVLAAVTLGYLIRSAIAAVTLYLAGGAFILAFQSTLLLLEWVNGSVAVFGAPFPKYSVARTWGYGELNLMITVVGIGLVLLGAWLRRRRSANRTAREGMVTVS